MSETIKDPLFGEYPVEIPLANAPLARVVAQVRFPEILSVQDRSFVAPFQERIRKQYSIAKNDLINTFVIGPQRMVSSTVWRYLDPSQSWRVSMSDTFLSLETAKYTSRKDFTERFAFLLHALAATIAPSHCTRIGIRYVDQVSLPDGESMKDMLRPEMAGIRDAIGVTKYVLSEFEANTREGAVVVRWGHMPAEGTHDPDVMPPTATASWFLDVDSYKSDESEMFEFAPDKISEVVFGLASRAYTIFLWSVNDTFLVRYGKEV